jgi:hypothetical protein
MNMKAYPIRLVLIAALVTTAAAQESTPSSPPPAAAPASPAAPAAPQAASPAAVSPAPAEVLPAAPPAPRLISSALAASLSAGMPKYAPPPPPSEQKPADDAEAADAIKPKNQVVRLPSIIVRGERNPVFRERDLNGTKNLTNIAMERYPGLKIPLIGFLNAPVAMQMYQEDQRLSDMAELKDDAATARRAGDSAGSQYIMRASNDTFGLGSALAPTPDGR